MVQNTIHEMNMKYSRYYLMLLISICSAGLTSNFLMAQKIDSDQFGLIRNITVAFPDSVVKAKVLEVTPKMKVVTDIDYYWYYNNQFQHNTGGFYGKLLHGKYLVFNTKNNLLVEGNFFNGIKTGMWKYWDTDGKLKSTAQYKNGKLNGQTVNFNISGNKSRTVEYKNGLMDGKETLYLRDTTIVNKFKAGQRIEKKKKALPDTTSVRIKKYKPINKQDSVSQPDKKPSKPLFRKKS